MTWTIFFLQSNTFPVEFVRIKAIKIKNKSQIVNCFSITTDHVGTKMAIQRVQGIICILPLIWIDEACLTYAFSCPGLGRFPRPVLLLRLNVVQTQKLCKYIQNYRRMHLVRKMQRTKKNFKKHFFGFILSTVYV